MKYLGVDYGTKKIGLALSDEGGRVAFAHNVIRSDKFAPSVVADLIYQEEIGAVVVGESRNLSGGVNAVAADAEQFADDLKKFALVEIYFEDERFSTAQARNVPAEGRPRGSISRSTSSVHGESIADAHAAAIILQSFLDKHNATS